MSSKRRRGSNSSAVSSSSAIPTEFDAPLRGPGSAGPENKLPRYRDFEPWLSSGPETKAIAEYLRVTPFFCDTVRIKNDDEEFVRFKMALVQDERLHDAFALYVGLCFDMLRAHLNSRFESQGRVAQFERRSVKKVYETLSRWGEVDAPEETIKAMCCIVDDFAKGSEERLFAELMLHVTRVATLESCFAGERLAGVIDKIRNE